MKNLTSQEEKQPHSPVAFILLLALLGAGGYFGWTAYSQRRAAQAAHRAEQLRLLKEQEASQRLPEHRATQADLVQAPTNDVTRSPSPEKEKKPPEKTPLEKYQAREAHRLATLKEVETARAKSPTPTLGGFAGVRFGEPFKGTSLCSWGTIGSEGDDVSSRGITCAYEGPPGKVMSFTSPPRVWVTPQTKRAYAVEFRRPLNLKFGGLHESETTKMVERLEKKFGQKMFSVLPLEKDEKNCLFMYPAGEATVRVEECDGELILRVEREDLRREALQESALVRQEKMTAQEEAKLLDSTRYPLGETVHMRVPKIKQGTPSSFCGLVFGRTPAPFTTIQTASNGSKSFFLNYRQWKVRPFRGFKQGKVELHPTALAVVGVYLTSTGATEGLDDHDFYTSTRTLLEKHYRVKCTESPSKSEMGPVCCFEVGDVTITFGPTATGEFFLAARHQVLAEAKVPQK